MQINLTFFIQIINFSITYWFLNKFMFNPVMIFLKQKKDKENNIKKEIKEKEEYLLKMEVKKGINLEKFREQIKEKYKFSTPKKPDISFKIDCVIDKNETKKLILQAKKILLKRVPHVD